MSFPFDIRTEQELRSFVGETLRQWMERVEALRIYVPRLRGEMRLLPGMPFHLRPELFLQLSGETWFRFPEEECCVGPGEACLVPRGMPHGERVRGLEGPFLNLVVMPERVVNLHLAREARKGVPGGFIGMMLEKVSPGFPVLLDEVVHLTNGEGWAADQGARGAFRAALASLLTALEGGGGKASVEPFKVMQARQWSMQLLHDPDFCVGTLAARMQCNVDYLSQLFRKSTGMTLQAYIHELRLQRALELLCSTALNVSQVSQAVGFRDPSYFTRAFRRWAGATPREMRRAGGDWAGDFRVLGRGL